MKLLLATNNRDYIFMKDSTLQTINIIFTLLISIVVALASYHMGQKQTAAQTVNTAAGLLSHPKIEVRRWAATVINNNAAEKDKMPEDVRRALIEITGEGSTQESGSDSSGQ